MPTLAELTDATCPKTDGLSFLPTLLGKSGQRVHSHLYWEYRNQTAVRMQQWKTYRGGNGDWELYDLSNDVEEKSNIASNHPDVLKQLIAYAEEAHEPVKKGQVFDRAVIQKDRRQAPHNRKPQ
jgi:arylsulfatase